jgi:hypothetical protein
MNSEPELIQKNEDDELACAACGSTFSADGQIVDRDVDKVAHMVDKA